MNSLKLVSLVICLHLSFIISAYGNIYRCIESDGSLTFQDYPCANQEKQKNKIFQQSPKTGNAENKKTETGSDRINLLGNVLSDDLKNVRISPFKARYYTENDGENPGKGNDGTIKDIVAKLQFTETVKRPSAHLTFPFHGIDSYNFYGIWEGTMHAFSEGQSAKAHFDVSWSDVSFYVNGILVEKWRNDSKIVQFNLNKGDNNIRVELHNHWHTTSFNVSFTDYKKLDKIESVEVFKEINFNSTKTVYLDAYESSANTSGNNYNEIFVTFPRSSAPIFLFLNSFQAVNWVINNPHNVKIVGVALRGNSPGSTVAMSSSAPIYEFPMSGNSRRNYYNIRSLVGKNADYAFAEYGLSHIIVPGFFQAKADDDPKGNGSISSSESSSPEQTDIYPVSSFFETLVVQRQNNTVSKMKIVKEPALDGTFVKGSWKGYFDVSQQTDKTFKILHQGIKVELIIDGRSVWRGKDSRDKIYQHTFKPGRHEVMFVAYPEEKSRPAKLKVSITDNAKDLKDDELAIHLKKLGDFDSIYCGVEKSNSPNQIVDIILKKSEKPVVLFLTSYKRATWDFKNGNTENIAAVVTSAKNASETIKNLPPHIPVYHFFRLANTPKFIPVSGQGISKNIDNTFKQAALQILALTGKLPTGFSGAIQAETIEIPEIILDREKYRNIGFSDVSSDYNVFIEYPQKIDAVFNPVTTKYIDPKSSLKFTRGKLIKPEVQRKSWAEPLGATEDIPTGAFRAYYFDIFNPGQPKFSGIVEDVSVSSSGKTTINSTRTASIDEYGIIPENFGAFWIGSIILEEDKEMEINIDSGNSSTRILIDNKVVKGRKILLKKGLHKVEIEHVNNWHTYNFSFSLNEPQTLLAYEELKGQLGDVLPRRVHTAYVGVADSKSGDNSITLNIENVDKPIFLILTSSSAINWVIEGPGAKDVKALLVSSMKSKSKIKGGIVEDIPRFYFPMRNTYQLESKCACQGRYYCSSRDLFDTLDYIATITGQKINSFTGNYNAKSLVIPETIIDEKQFKNLRQIAENNLLLQSRCEGSEFTPPYLNDLQRKQIDNHDSVQAAIKIMELIRDNRFDEYVQFLEPKRLKADPVEYKKFFLIQHNAFAGYDPLIAYHLIDKKMYEKIVANNAKLTIPLVLKRKNLKDYYIKVHINKAGDRWLVSYME